MTTETQTASAVHQHVAEYPSRCEGCEWIAAEMVKRMPPGLRLTQDEWKRLAPREGDDK